MADGLTEEDWERIENYLSKPKLSRKPDDLLPETGDDGGAE